MEEQKESQIRIKQLENEIKIWDLKNLDVDKFEQCQWQEILQWIVSLDDGKFKKYEQDLRKNLKEEEIAGIALKDVDASDVKRWGVTKFSDMKTLRQHIKQLVDKNRFDNLVSVANEEGAVSGGYYK